MISFHDSSTSLIAATWTQVEKDIFVGYVMLLFGCILVMLSWVMMIQTVDILSTAKQFLVSSTSIILLQGKILPSLHF